MSATTLLTPRSVTTPSPALELSRTSSSSPKRVVYLYDDSFGYATYPDYVNTLESKLLAYPLARAQIVRIHDVGTLARECAREKKATLIIPHGRISALSRRLKPSAAAIRTAVASGWNYLGSGSGGSFGCVSLSSELSSKERTADFAKAFGTEFLGLLPLHAHESLPGTTLEAPRERILITLHAPQATATVTASSVKHTLTPLPQSRRSNLRLEASIPTLEEEALGCVYSGNYGKGRVVISLVHPEFDEGVTSKRLPQLLVRLFDQSLSL